MHVRILWWLAGLAIFSQACGGGAAPASSTPSSSGTTSTAAAPKPAGASPSPVSAGASPSAVSAVASPSPAAAASSGALFKGTLFPDFKGEQLTWVSNGGAFQEGAFNLLVRPWADQTGATVGQDSPVDYAKVKAQVESGNVTWDVVNTQSTFSVPNCGTLVEHTADIDKSAIPKEYLFDDCSVPIGIAAYVLVYNKTMFGANPPQSWADYFDLARYPGKRGVWANINTAPFEIALLADGVQPSQLYPIDYDRALKKWQTIKGSLASYPALGASSEQLTSQAVAMAVIVVTRALPAVKQGAPYEVVWNQNIETLATYSVIKGTQHLDAAKSLLQYMATPTPQSGMAREQAIGPVANGADLPSDPVDRAFNASVPEYRKAAVIQDAAWWGTHLDEGAQRWATFLAG